MTYDKNRHVELEDSLAKAEKEFFEVGSQIKDLSDKDGALSDSELSQHFALESDHKRISREVEMIRAQLGDYSALKPVENKKAEKDSPLRRYLTGGAEALSESEQNALLVANPMGRGADAIKITALSTDDAQGQEVIPTEVAPGVIDRLKHYGGIQRMARTFETGNANNFRMPSADETAKTGSYQGQLSTIAESDVGNLGYIEFSAHTANSGIVPVAREALDDVGFDLAGWIGRQVSTRIGRVESTAFTTGSGSGQPSGFVGETTLGVTAASATTITVGELIELTYQVDLGYLQDVDAGPRSPLLGQGRVGFLMSRSVEQAIRALLDSDGRPMWQPDLTGGTPGRLLGYDYELSAELPAIASGVSPLYFGAWEHFNIRRVRGLEVMSFMDSNTIKQNAVHVIGFSRADSKMAGPKVATKNEAIVHLTMA